MKKNPGMDFNPKSNPDSELIEYLSNLDKNIAFLKLIKKNLNYIPEIIGEFINLEILILSDNKLRTIPKSIGKLKKLHTFVVTTNNLTHLPPEIGELDSLKILNLGVNELNDLPLELGNLDNLNQLDIDKNYFNRIPAVISQLKNAKSIQHFYFSINKNPLRSIGGIPRKILTPIIYDIFLEFYYKRKNKHFPNLNLTKKGYNLIKKSYTVNKKQENIKNMPAIEQTFSYYDKHITDIALYYGNNPNSISNDEKTRLIHEAMFRERDILKKRVGSKDPVLTQIDERLRTLKKNHAKNLL